MLESVKDRLPGAGAEGLLAEGRQILDSLSSADARQESKRLRELPDTVRRFFETRGRLCYALKAINDAGRKLHERNPQAASSYNLSTLHRKAATEEKRPA